MSNILIVTLTSALFLHSINAFAFKSTEEIWEKFTVEGAQCGTGDSYAVYIRQGRKDKVAMEFEGGGACWDRNSCFGPVPLTNLSAHGPQKRQGVYSPNQNQSPLFDATFVHFPYCTGDVFSGSHDANYQGKLVRHQGHVNTIKALQQMESRINLFNPVQEFYLIGESAGAIGALVSLPIVEQYLAKSVQKTALIDSPGLHFGNTFWQKFPDQYFLDLQEHLQTLGISAKATEGNIAKDFGNICVEFSDWKIGLIQSTRDIIMSIVFGNTSQSAHAKLVMSDLGITELAREQMGQCSVWVNDSSTHTFIGNDKDIARKTEKVSARDFVNSIFSNKPTRSTIPKKLIPE